MNTSKTMPWVLGAALLALAIIAGAWLLLISPGLSAAADNRQQAESEQSRIDQLQMQIVQLKKDYANLDEFKATLGALQTQIPPTANISELTRQLDAMAQATGVYLTSVVPSTSLEVAPPAAPAPAADAGSSDGTVADGTSTDGTATDGTATDGTATDGAATDGAAAPQAQPGPQAPANFYAIPIEVRLVGGYDATLAFIEQVQTINPRLLLVTSLALTGQTEASPAEGGRPALKVGDPETVLQAYAYVLAETPVADLEAATAGTTDGSATDETPAPTLPVPSGRQPNPFS